MVYYDQVLQLFDLNVTEHVISLAKKVSIIQETLFKDVSGQTYDNAAGVFAHVWTYIAYETAMYSDTVAAEV